MDITIRLSPRRIERAVFILIIIVLIISNITFYRNQGSVQQTTEPIVEEPQTEPEETAQEQDTTQDTAEETQDTEPNPETGDCTEGWKCKPNVPYRGYQNSDCSWDVDTYVLCDNGCEDGECMTAD
ncbi:MAG: hypothetical protein ABIG93_05915 [archaeon]